MVYKIISIQLYVLLLSQYSFAFNIDGKYSFKGSGCTGEMTVKESNMGINPHIIVRIVTVCTEQAHICDFEAKGERVVSSDNEILSQFESINNDDLEPAKFSTGFTKYGASIKVSERGAFCGMNAYYDGKWTRDGVKQSIQKNKTNEATEFCSEYIKVKKNCYYKAKNGVYPNKAILSLKKTIIPDEARDNACRDGLAAYGRVGDIKESDMKKALQLDFNQCYDEMIKE